MPRQRVNVVPAVTDPVRQSTRDRKLIERKLALARRIGATRLRCPCRLCNRGLRTSYSLKTVARHVRFYGYHPSQRGRTEGCEADASDLEWEEHIAREYGEAGRRRTEEARNADAAAVDVVEVIRESFGVWDNVRIGAADAAVEREREPSPDANIGVPDVASDGTGDQDAENDI
ncbi:hypothetical protein M758_UG105400 [Ceratodon purpureus]|nr:hypothetical protein M758_UG105400 [Ceratodon purpureus]